MKLIYYSIAVTLFCMASLAAPTGRAGRQADNMCSCTRNLAYKSELRTGLRILRDTICPSGRSERKTIHMVAALCKVLIASRDNQRLSEEQKGKINNKTCDMFQQLNVPTISDCTDRELTALQCSRAITCSHLIGNDEVDDYLDNGDEDGECWLNRYLCPLPTNVEDYIRGQSTIGL